MDDPREFAFIIILVLFISFVSYKLGMVEGKKQEINRAVKAGVAEYYVDDANSQKFRYICEQDSAK